MSALRAACVLLLPMCGVVTGAAAQDTEGDCTPTPEQRVRNPDGSRLRIISQCVEGLAQFQIDYSPRDGAAFVSLDVLDQDASFGEPFRSVGFVDLDEDGEFEIEARGACGAGPNCLGEIYRAQPDEPGLSLVFTGGYAELRTFEGHLLESGRASCCSWEFHAWNLAGHAEPMSYDTMDLMITVGADLDSDTDDAPARCTFSRRSGDNWQVIAPPGRAWLELCKVYGDTYHLVTPEQAQAEQAAAQEQ